MGTLSAPVGPATWFCIDHRAADARARREAVALATRLGFGDARAAEVGIVAAELTSNVARHGGGGDIVLRRVRCSPQTGLGLLAMDRGPGIADLALAVRDGVSTSSTLGIGLGAVQRLAAATDIYSVPGRGTVIDAVVCPGGSVADGADVGGLSRPMTNEEVCGDSFAVVAQGSRHVAVLADGLGHGPLAAAASQAAVQVLIEGTTDGPAALLAEMGSRLRHTRGAAVAVADVDLDERVLRFAGVGNVAGWILHDERRQGMPSQPGIVGGRPPRAVRERVFALTPGAVVVLHSDGLTDKWELTSYPGIRARTAPVIAAVLLRDAGVRHDDACVAVLKTPR